MLSKTGNDIFKLRYALTEDETWEKACNRVAGFMASAEEDKARVEWESKFKKIIYDLDFIPGGRILRNSGRRKGMLSNCFVLGVDDDIYSIGYWIAETLIVSSFGGGVGVNVSSVRPKGDQIMGKGGNASGAISFLHGMNEVAKIIEAGGQRRAAMIAVLNCDHPEIFTFLDAKLKEGQLDYFNISVGITDEFIKAVKKNKDWDLKFNNKVYKTIKAVTLWKKLIKNAYDCGDPGILNLTNIQKFSNTSYYEVVECTNPCGEIVMAPNNLCDLGSINLSNMYHPPSNSVSWKHLKETIFTAVRFLDNVLDMTFYPLPKIEEASTASRRIGLGTLGLHHLLLKMGLRYGSDESLEFIDELYSKIRDSAYLASIDIAKAKGSFKKLDIEKYMDTNFIKSLPRRVQTGIRTSGIRNSSLLTIAPTGTTSMLVNTSSGIEPVIAPVYKRTYNISDEKGEAEEKQVILVDPIYAELVDADKSTEHFTTAHDISPEMHLEMQISIQRYVDSSISKTINIPSSYPMAKLDKVLLDAVPALKGVTIYKSGSKGKEPLVPVDHTKMKKEEILDLAKETYSKDSCKNGTCDL